MPKAPSSILARAANPPLLRGGESGSAKRTLLRTTSGELRSLCSDSLPKLLSGYSRARLRGCGEDVDKVLRAPMRRNCPWSSASSLFLFSSRAKSSCLLLVAVVLSPDNRKDSCLWPSLCFGLPSSLSPARCPMSRSQFAKTLCGFFSGVTTPARFRFWLRQLGSVFREQSDLK